MLVVEVVVDSTEVGTGPLALSDLSLGLGGVATVVEGTVVVSPVPGLNVWLRLERPLLVLPSIVTIEEEPFFAVSLSSSILGLTDCTCDPVVCN